MAISCLLTATCPFHQNWKEQASSDKIDIIVNEREEKNPYYNCLALIALNDPETGIPMNDELKNRLLHPEPPHTCLYITFLNYLSKLGKI